MSSNAKWKFRLKNPGSTSQNQTFLLFRIVALLSNGCQWILMAAFWDISLSKRQTNSAEIPATGLIKICFQDKYERNLLNDGHFCFCVCVLLCWWLSFQKALQTNNGEHTFVLIPKLDWKGTDLFLTYPLWSIQHVFQTTGLHPSMSWL